MSGYVFVIQGNVARLRCDARLIPVDNRAIPNNGFLLESVEPTAGVPPPAGWKKGAPRTFFWGAAEGGPDLWFTNVGMGPPGRDRRWVIESVREWMTMATGRLSAPEARRIKDRALPLLAMHLVASGGSNAEWEMGELIPDLLDVVEDFVASHDVDVAFVVNSRVQYAALQAARRSRRGGSRLPLPDSLMAVASRLAERARSGRLSVLTGAGISMGAGLPGWQGLLDSLTDEVQDVAKRSEIKSISDLTVKAQLLATVIGDGFKERIAARCRGTRVALLHGILSNLPVNEYVTLNYDRLFETATRDAGRDIDVIPHHRRNKGIEWMLKLHGCESKPDSIILTSDDYQKFSSAHEAFAGIVQSQLITRHMMFVGFGMADPNIERVIDTVLRAVGGDSSGHADKLGTVFLLDSTPPKEEWCGAFEFVRVHDDTEPNAPISARARKLEIVLDQVALEAADPYEFLLDARFDGLLGAGGRKVRETTSEFYLKLGDALKDDPAAARIMRQLEAMGLHRVSKPS